MLLLLLLRWSCSDPSSRSRAGLELCVFVDEYEYGIAWSYLQREGEGDPRVEFGRKRQLYRQAGRQPGKRRRSCIPISLRSPGTPYVCTRTRTDTYLSGAQGRTERPNNPRGHDRRFGTFTIICPGEIRCFLGAAGPAHNGNSTRDVRALSLRWPLVAASSKAVGSLHQAAFVWVAMWVLGSGVDTVYRGWVRDFARVLFLCCPNASPISRVEHPAWSAEDRNTM